MKRRLKILDQKEELPVIVHLTNVSTRPKSGSYERFCGVLEFEAVTMHVHGLLEFLKVKDHKTYEGKRMALCTICYQRWQKLSG